MSTQQQHQENQEHGQNQQQVEENPNALTEQDKKVYGQIMQSINRMDKKLKHVKQKVPAQENPQNSKRSTVNQIAQKIIESKQNSDIITKQDLVADVQQTFQHMVVNVYTQNQQLKNKVNSLIAIIKDQNKKLNQHKQREQKLQQQNEKLRLQLIHLKDGNLLVENQQSHTKKVTNQSNVVNKNPGRNKTSHDNEDYDFWSMPNNESSVKKRKDFVSDSGLWVNNKDIDKSVFITDQQNKK